MSKRVPNKQNARSSISAVRIKTQAIPGRPCARCPRFFSEQAEDDRFEPRSRSHFPRLAAGRVQYPCTELLADTVDAFGVQKNNLLNVDTIEVKIDRGFEIRLFYLQY
jgi:hypothetical protein